MTVPAKYMYGKFQHYKFTPVTCILLLKYMSLTTNVDRSQECHVNRRVCAVLGHIMMAIVESYCNTG